jgi:hypothetical protein
LEYDTTEVCSVSGKGDMAMEENRGLGFGGGFGFGNDIIWWIIIILIIVCLFCPGIFGGFGGYGCKE